MNSSKRKLPKDIERSITTRAEGMMRKAMELTKLGVRVAFYIEKTDEGKALRFKTHSAMEPNWELAANIVSGKSEQEPPAVRSPDLRSTPSLPDVESLNLNWPSMGGTPKIEPLPELIWDDVKATSTPESWANSGKASAKAPPLNSKIFSAGSASGPSRKRPLSLDDASSSELRTSKRTKRKEPPSPWFEK
ncbi:hypothetical protein FOCG_17543 [Fusarium oxysporum f. sp. radicis-lycopersici 26381]|nr:hypothetical protein FOCG_17543 [Fusarium oxysporum f. sp. radicis-lycopersici 26381]